MRGFDLCVASSGLRGIITCRKNLLSDKKTPGRTGRFHCLFFMLLANCSEGGKNEKNVSNINCSVFIYIICTSRCTTKLTQYSKYITDRNQQVTVKVSNAAIIGLFYAWVEERCHRCLKRFIYNVYRLRNANHSIC